jgi:amidase
MTRTVRDAALTLDILVGYDPDDSYTAASVISPPPNGGSYAANLSPQVLSTARIGVLQSVFGPDTDPECSAVNSVVRAGLSRIKDSGTTLIDIEIPNLEHYLSITRVYSSRARYDVDEFLTNHPQITASTASIHASKSFHPALPLFNSLATGVSHPYEDPLYVQRLEEREEFQRIVIGIMALHNLDAIAYPSVKIPAPTIDDVLGKRFVDGFPTNTGIASQLRMPAVSVPVGFTNETGLPVGLELLGLLYREQTLLELAFGVETLMKARRSPAF